MQRIPQTFSLARRVGELIEQIHKTYPPKDEYEFTKFKKNIIVNGNIGVISFFKTVDKDNLYHNDIDKIITQLQSHIR